MTRKSLGAKAQNFRKSEVLKLKEIFDSHDKDGGGDVCCTELLADTSTSFSKTCESSNMKLEYAKSVFAQLDVNGDSRITFQEYLTHCYPRATMLERSQMLDWVTNKSERPETPPVEITSEQVEEIRNIFLIYDTDGSGYLDYNELIGAMSASGYVEEELEGLFEASESDKDGAISFEEFMGLLRA
jgi:Ca2+-binding EF-hand superfamily protein